MKASLRQCRTWSSLVKSSNCWSNLSNKLCGTVWSISWQVAEQAGYKIGLCLDFALSFSRSISLVGLREFPWISSLIVAAFLRDWVILLNWHMRLCKMWKVCFYPFDMVIIIFASCSFHFLLRLDENALAPLAALPALRVLNVFKEMEAENSFLGTFDSFLLFARTLLEGIISETFHLWFWQLAYFSLHIRHP